MSSAPVVLGDHTWVASATITISEADARTADRRGYYKTAEQQRVDVLETYCRVCRRTYEDAKGQQCVIGQVLRGGPIDTRKRRQADDDEEGDPRTLSALAG